MFLFWAAGAVRGTTPRRGGSGGGPGPRRAPPVAGGLLPPPQQPSGGRPATGTMGGTPELAWKSRSPIERRSSWKRAICEFCPTTIRQSSCRSRWAFAFDRSSDISMAIIACKECAREVSDQAACCPHCGVSIAAGVRRKPRRVKAWFYGTLILGLLAWGALTTLWLRGTISMPRELVCFIGTG